MQEPEHDPRDQQDYTTPSLPYVPDQSETGSRQDQPVNTTETPSTPDVPLIPEGTHQPVPESAVAQNADQPKRRRWWLLAGIAVCAVALPLIIFGVWGYLNRSTPIKTLDMFCGALQREDYHTAFSQFSPKLQAEMVTAQMNEKTFSILLAQDKIVSCTHGDAGEGNANAMTSLKLVHASQNVNNDIVTLTKDGASNWKIDQLQVAP